MDAINKNTYDDDIEDKKKEEDLNGIPVAEDEPIYAISDFEGRFDYYIRFFTDIGFLKKDTLLNVIKDNINKSSNTEKEKDEELKMLKMFFDKPDEWFKKAYYKDKNDKWCKVWRGDDICKINCQRLNFLKTHLNADVLKQAINKDFKGTIVINGDLYSSRVNFLFDRKKDEIVSINELCFNLFNTIKTDDYVKDKLILVAGNHDVYHMDYIDGSYYNRGKNDILKDIKNKTLPFLIKWYKVKTKDSKMLIFKHSPRLMEDAMFGKELSEIIDNEDDHMETGLTEIIDYKTAIKTDSKKSGLMYQYYFYNGFEIDKTTGQKIQTFNKDDDINKKVKTMLTDNQAKLVVGHCHAGGTIKDGCMCIDDDGKYKYRVFHLGKKQDVLNDTNNVDDECNSLNSTRESIYFDDIQDNVMPGMSANHLNYNNNNHLFPQGHIKQKNPNITNEQFQQILQNNKDQLPPNFDTESIKKLFNDVYNKKNNTKPAQKKVIYDNNQCNNNNVNNVNCNANAGSDGGHFNNPIFKIMYIDSEHEKDKDNVNEKNDANSANGNTNKAQCQPTNINDRHDGQNNNNSQEEDNINNQNNNINKEEEIKEKDNNSLNTKIFKEKEENENLNLGQDNNSKPSNREENNINNKNNDINKETDIKEKDNNLLNTKNLKEEENKNLNQEQNNNSKFSNGKIKLYSSLQDSKINNGDKREDDGQKDSGILACLTSICDSCMQYFE